MRAIVAHSLGDPDVLQLAEAHRLLESRQAVGKIVLRVD